MARNSLAQIIKVRAAANKWISDNFPQQRKYLSHMAPEYDEKEKAWLVGLTAREINGRPYVLGYLLINDNTSIIEHQNPESISDALSRLLDMQKYQEADGPTDKSLEGRGYKFIFGDGVEASSSFKNRSVDLLLTDPPYGISKPYTCEKQIPRRLRKDGRDFIMPKGHFGNWDREVCPHEWTDIVLPKVGGWAVIFCAQSQIGEYSAILKNHRFNAVGTLVWRKTNPVPFNHKYKPINAWEALVIGKRPGTKFNGKVVHNVFTCKSPSPQQRIHPTQKPVPLISEFVRLFSQKDCLVFDPFAGSATTVVAGVSSGRRVLAYENDLTIYQSACERIRRDTAGNASFWGSDFSMKAEKNGHRQPKTKIPVAASSKTSGNQSKKIEFEAII